MNNEKKDNTIYQNALNKIKEDEKNKPTNYSIIIPDKPKVSGLKAYGGRFNDNHQVIKLVVGSESQVSLPSTMPKLNTTYTNNSIKIKENGVYEINYFLNVSLELATFLTLAIRNNGVKIPSTIISRLVDVDVGTIYSGSTIVELEEGSEIDMVIEALIMVGVTFGTGVNASISVKKLN